jgi:maltose/maltodextrin transport system substrate-binding protein
MKRRAGLLAASGALLLPHRARATPSAAKPLTIWFRVEGAKALRALGERFTAETGVPVVVKTPDEGPQKHQQASAAGKGPEIYVYAHDRIGEWIAGGLIAAVHPSAALRADIDPLPWRGFTQGGRT